MSQQIVYQIIPFSFIFVFIIFLLSLKKNKIITNKVEENLNENKTLLERTFLENSESKLVALRELYKQDLIGSEIYVKKTELIANSIAKKIGKDIFEFAQNKKNEIYESLKGDIIKKANTDKNNDNKTDLDLLISSVDKRIEKGIYYEKK